jgi:mazG family protein
MPPFVVNEMKILPQKAGKCACALAFRPILRYNFNLFADVFGMRKGDAPMQDWTPREHYTAEDLVEIIRILRDRENGCPWDKVQTHASIRKNFLEETCEALEAIDADDPVMMQEELGDVLMQVVFHTVIEEERGRFDMEKVCREVCEKLVFRHPNIFASSAAENAGINSWDALKNKEKGRTTLADELDTVPATLPALMRAQKLQKRAARFGCGPEDAAGAARALDSARAAWDAQQTAENAGELLLAAADAMRLAGVDAEEALTFAAKRFTQRLEADET